MQSTNIIAYRGRGFFGVPIIGNTSFFAIKFDTGAANTVISVEKISGDLTDEQLKKIKDYITSQNIHSKEFKSASGHTFNAYPSYMTDITIGSHLFNRFFYYIVIDRLFDDRKLALLGDDFIDCCGFSREPHGNIIIDKFDFSAYRSNGNMISTDEILSMV